MKTNEVYFAMSREQRKASLLPFRYWEEVQMAFRWGILLPDGTRANAIGRCKSEADFRQRAKATDFQVVEN